MHALHQGNHGISVADEVSSYFVQGSSRARKGSPIMKSKFLALAALIALSVSSTARADFVVQVTENGGSWTTVASSSSSSGVLSFGGTYGDFSILGGFSSSN